MDVVRGPFFLYKRPMFLFLLLPLISFAAVQKYDLKLSYAVNEDKPINGRILISEGKTATMKSKSHFLEVVAEEGKIMNRSGILLSFNVVEMVDGKRQVITQPKLLVKDSEEAQITIDDVALTVTASRKSNK